MVKLIIIVFSVIWFPGTYAENVFSDDIQNMSFSFDKELKILIHKSPSYVII